MDQQHEKMEKRFSQAAGVEFEAVDGSGVLLDMRSGKYFRLNETGSEVWRLLAETSDPDEITTKVSTSHDLRAVDIRGDIDSLLGEMVRLGVVVAEG